MYFDISADLIYTRPILTKKNDELIIIQENIQVKTQVEKLTFLLPADYTLALENQSKELTDLFNIQKLGKTTAAIFCCLPHSNHANPYVKATITNERVGLRGPDVWCRKEAMSEWDKDFSEFQKWYNVELDRDYCFENGYKELSTAFNSFDEFSNYFSSDAIGEIINTWYEDGNGKKLTKNTSIDEIGNINRDKFLKEHYSFTGFKNITSIKCNFCKGEAEEKLILDEVISKARKISRDTALYNKYSLHERLQAIDIEHFKGWHKEKLEFFQNSIDIHGLNSPHLQSAFMDSGKKIVEKVNLEEKFKKFIGMTLEGIFTGFFFLGLVAFFLGIIVPVFDWLKTGDLDNYNLFDLTGLSYYTRFTSWIGTNQIISGFFDLNIFILYLIAAVIVVSIIKYIHNRFGPFD